jgi:Protein of unknown function (DUF1566)
VTIRVLAISTTKGKTMKRILSYSAVIIGLGLITSSAFAQTTANGPYYATPSWDQQLPAATRFIVLANWGSAAVLDRETGLVWEKSPSTSKFTWSLASAHCWNLNVGGRAGWRLPGLQELLSLVDRSVSPGPALPSGHPFTNVQSGFDSGYFSATAKFADATGVLAVVLDSGGIGLFDNFNQHFAWCVRGGQGGDTQ